MFYLDPPYSRWKYARRPWPPSWMRRRLNVIQTAMNVHPYFMNKVGRDIERERAGQRR